MARSRLSLNMRRALCAMVDGVSVADVIGGWGRNEHGTMIALKDRGLVRFVRGGGWALTEEGRGAVANARAASVSGFGPSR